MTTPLDDIENERGQKDIGVFAYRVYKGAFEDSGSRLEAFTVVLAFFLAMFKNYEDEE